MSGQQDLAQGKTTHKRLVKMPDASILNRYWDPSATPRPESFKEDLEAAQQLTEDQRADYYQNIRAACESGWDFSSRWLQNPDDLNSIQTTHIVPVDLNCLLYKLESSLAYYWQHLGNTEKHIEYTSLASQRQQAIQRYMWNEAEGLYFDYHIQCQAQTEIKSLASTLPLFTKLATQQQAEKVCQQLLSGFLVEGGLLTTQSTSPQQWDSPNGWAPLHWFAVQGLKNYDLHQAVQQIMTHWLTTVENYYTSNNSMMEKYNLLQPEQQASGGEYQVQHGFGWTNGVTQAFYHLLKENDM